jgi:hypothetical protein
MLTLPEVLRRVKGLNLPPDDFLIYGSGPMLAHGLIETVSDVDLVARGAAWRLARRLGAVEDAPGGDRVVRLEAVDIFDGWLGVELTDLWGRREWLHDLPWASLGDVLEYKQRLNRPKDALHLQLLRQRRLV